MTKKHITVQGVDENIWRKFRGKCVLLNITVGDRLNQLLAEDVTFEATADDLLRQAVKEG